MTSEMVMTEERARELIGVNATAADGAVNVFDGYKFVNRPAGSDWVLINGSLSVDELEALAWMMRHR